MLSVPLFPVKGGQSTKDQYSMCLPSLESYYANPHLLKPPDAKVLLQSQKLTRSSQLLLPFPSLPLYRFLNYPVKSRRWAWLPAKHPLHKRAWPCRVPFPLGVSLSESRMSLRLSKCSTTQLYHLPTFYFETRLELGNSLASRPLK